MQRRNQCRCRFQSDRFIRFRRLSKFKRNDRRERGFVFYEHIGHERIGLNIKLAGNVGHNVS